MAKKFLLMVVTSVWVFGAQLGVISGSIKAHTEVFGDSTIDPATQKIIVNIQMEDSIESIKGSVAIKSADLVSDNKDRDEHMYEAIEVEKYPTITYKINSVTSKENGYVLHGEFTLHGVTKTLNVPATIEQKEDGTIALNSSYSILSSEYGIKPIKLLFLTVRDQIDIMVSLNLKGK